MFAAKLRLPQSTSDNEKIERVAELLGLLGLSHVADGIVGKEGRRGISGGERKRVSIGVELITSPDVLFLDEPTSGLGAYLFLRSDCVLYEKIRGRLSRSLGGGARGSMFSVER